MQVYLGIDFGTSGARAIAINQQEEILGSWRLDLSTQTAPIWRETLWELLSQIPVELRQTLQAIAIDGTSSTVLLCDQLGNPLEEVILYNDDRGVAVLDKVREIAPENNVVNNANSALAKLLWWDNQGLLNNAKYFLHQADWLSFLLHGQLGLSDYHNVLKLGYDVYQLNYPDWLIGHAWSHLFPKVGTPGEVVAAILPAIAEQFGINSGCQICYGTTDSTAAFIASGVKSPGEAVTSLGSTLVLKLLSEIPTEDQSAGIYSHRFGDLWLTGGGSNTGGAVLKYFFSDAELAKLSQQIDWRKPTDFNYYPLLKPGDRFPINDPFLPPKLTPKPADPVLFLQGLLEGMARIEAQGYQQLQALGATPIRVIYTAGGGSKNLVWQQIRQQYLQPHPVKISANTEAAYGAALLAKNGLPKISAGLPTVSTLP